MLVCEACDAKCIDIKEWRTHLISKKHQNISKLTVQSCSAKMKQRTIVVHNLNNHISRSSGIRKLLNVFEEWDLVHDIYIHDSISNIKACVILLDSRNSVNAFFGNKKTVEFDSIRNSVCIRRSHLSSKEWYSIIPSSKEDNFEERNNNLKSRLKDKPLDQQIDMFLESITLNDDEIEKRNQYVQKLKGIIEKGLPHCEVKPFGSFISGLCFNDSDIDIHVSSDGRQQNLETQIATFEKVFEILKQKNRIAGLREPLFKLILPIRGKYYNILRLMSGENNIQVDLSFGSTDSIQNSNLIKFYVNYDPQIRPLAMIILHWARFYQFIGSDKMKSYALKLLIIVFLCKKGIVPTVLDLKGGKSFYALSQWLMIKDMKEEAKNHRMSNPKFGSSSKPVLLNLALEFFEMYASLNCKNYFVCPFLGTFIEKNKLQKLTLPPGLVWGEVKSLMGTLNCDICVQDPLCLGINVTQNMRKDIIIADFQKACKKSADILQKLVIDDNKNQDGFTTFLFC